MKTIKILGIIFLVLVTGVVIWYFAIRKKELKIVLETEKPLYGYISRSVTATGTIQPVDTVTVGAQVSGTIKYVFADFNSIVKKGELIAQLDKSLLNAQVHLYQANLAVAKSQLIFEKSTFERQTLLYNTGAISKMDYESALYQYNSAKAMVQSVQAQLDGAIKTLSFTDIYSPVDGVVMQRNINIGQTVASSFSTPTFFVIAKDITNMQVEAAVDEADIGNVQPGQRSVFTVDAYPDNTFTGNVQQIRLEPTVTANVVTYITIIKAPNGQLKLKPGMTANIIIYTKEDSNAMIISEKALKFNPDPTLEKQFKIIALNIDSITKVHAAHHQQNLSNTSKNKVIDSTGAIIPKVSFVWVKLSDSLIQKEIIIGLNDNTNVQILKGLKPTDEVVDNLSNQTKTDIKATGVTTSPFMPKMGGGKKPK